MFNLGAGEIVFILVVALLVLGPKRLPEMARGIGQFMRALRRQTDEVRSVVEREFYRMDQEMNVDPSTGDLVQGKGPRAPLPPPVERPAHTAPGTPTSDGPGAISAGPSPGAVPGRGPGPVTSTSPPGGSREDR